jgi:hypothetical protein
VGTNAHASQVVHYGSVSEGRAQLQQQMEELRTAIAAQARNLNNVQQLLDSADLAAKELKKKEPNKVMFTGLLGGIGTAVQTVSGLASLADKIAQLAAKYL